MVVEIGSGCVALLHVNLIHLSDEGCSRTGLAGIVASMLGGSVWVTDQAYVYAS